MVARPQAARCAGLLTRRGGQATAWKAHRDDPDNPKPERCPLTLSRAQTGSATPRHLWLPSPGRASRAAPVPIRSWAPLDRQSTGIPLKHEVSNSTTLLGLEQNTLKEVNCEQTSGNARVHAQVEEFYEY